MILNLSLKSSYTDSDCTDSVTTRSTSSNDGDLDLFDDQSSTCLVGIHVQRGSSSSSCTTTGSSMTWTTSSIEDFEDYDDLDYLDLNQFDCSSDRCDQEQETFYTDSLLASNKDDSIKLRDDFNKDDLEMTKYDVEKIASMKRKFSSIVGAAECPYEGLNPQRAKKDANRKGLEVRKFFEQFLLDNVDMVKKIERKAKYVYKAKVKCDGDLCCGEKDFADGVLLEWLIECYCREKEIPADEKERIKDAIFQEQAATTKTPPTPPQKRVSQKEKRREKKLRNVEKPLSPNPTQNAILFDAEVLDRANSPWTLQIKNMVMPTNFAPYVMDSHFGYLNAGYELTLAFPP